MTLSRRSRITHLPNEIRRMHTSRILSIASLSLAVTVLSSACVMNGTSTRGAISVGDDHGQVTLMFSDHDRDYIHRYYRGNLPPGLAKRDQLPPGLRKQLVRRGTLPPGLQSQRLPYDLDRHLSRLPEGYARIRVASDVLLIDERTRVIFDVITDVGR